MVVRISLNQRSDFLLGFRSQIKPEFSKWLTNGPRRREQSSAGARRRDGGNGNASGPGSAALPDPLTMWRGAPPPGGGGGGFRGGQTLKSPERPTSPGANHAATAAPPRSRAHPH